jgi:hypothetical protein
MPDGGEHLGGLVAPGPDVAGREGARGLQGTERRKGSGTVDHCCDATSGPGVPEMSSTANDVR